jgi:cardiolipin-specific phospholipase
MDWRLAPLLLVFFFLIVPILLPFLLLGLFFDYPALVASAASAAILSLAAPSTAGAVASGVGVGWGIVLHLLAHHLLRRGAARGSSHSLLSPLYALVFTAPPIATALAFVGVGGIPAPHAVACVVGPLALALATTRLWFCRASLDGAAAAQAAVFEGALMGTGVTVTFSKSREGLCVAEFRAGARAAGDGAPPIVLLHGYGAGSALFFQQAAALAKGHRGAVFFVDWAGMGCSSRPHWPCGRLSVRAAEDALLLPLESWLVERSLGPAFFVAHSLGGYLATALWLRNPQCVAGLALLSPAGWAGVGAEVPLPPLQRPADSAGGGSGAGASPPPQQQPPHPPPPQPTGAPPPSSAPAEGAPPPAPPPAPALRRVRLPRFLFAFFGRLWDSGVTPMTLLRGCGPCGAVCVRASLRGRASRWLLETPLPPATLAALGTWLFHQLCAPPSGEAALAALLAPGAWAREPLLPRLRAAVAAGALPPTVPVLWLYGDYDWMSFSAGEEAAGALRAAGWRFAECKQVRRAGHHLYLEAPTETNAAVLHAAALAKR